MRASRWMVAVLAMVCGGAGALRADPVVEYQISGTIQVPTTGYAQIDGSRGVFGIQLVDAGTTGGFGPSLPSFNETRPEFFSDPVFDPEGTFYSRLRTFSFFGIYETYDDDDNLLESRLFLSARPTLGLAGQSITQTFQSFFDARPGLTEAQLVQAVRDGADFPEPGANTLFIDFRDQAVESVFQGNIGTNFQSPETLTVYLFGDAGAAAIGDITVNAVLVPEPATTALLALGAIALTRRSRQPQIARMQ